MRASFSSLPRTLPSLYALSAPGFRVTSTGFNTWIPMTPPGENCISSSSREFSIWFVVDVLFCSGLSILFQVWDVAAMVGFFFVLEFALHDFEVLAMEMWVSEGFFSLLLV